ncbi:hypothetical protein JOF29_006391 [Kribbella aluminosa]|uniref:Uncharacterized protein n=1 Tax=Kribbella aluminosa TaxID=416017 RepID=A0ABS4UUG9_9ACTN|nr:hypothetical protein [Kribbella aluminosa]MBP2355281.1 hypothetical protein [Kribbella aluminosa]
MPDVEVSWEYGVPGLSIGGGGYVVAPDVRSWFDRSAVRREVAFRRLIERWRTAGGVELATWFDYSRAEAESTGLVRLEQ